MLLRPIAIVFLSAVLLAALALLFKSRSIESDISTRVTSELTSKGFGWAVVKVEGRNILLDGTAPNKSFKRNVAELANGVWGVYRVKSRMEVAVKSAEDITSPPANLPNIDLGPSEYNTKIIFGRGKISFSGTVPSAQLKKEIYRLASGLLPEGRVIDDLIVKSASPNNWRTVFGLGFSQLSRLKSGQMTLQDNVLRLSGQAWSYESISSIKHILYSGLPDPYLSEISLKITPPGSIVDKTECQALIDSLKRTTRIFFDTNSARIKRKSYALLDKLAYTLKRCPSHKVRIEGHTDNQGPGERNWRLSKQRAESVKQFLVRSGLKEKRVYTRGYGEARPVASNHHASGRALNRRIELVVTKHKFVEVRESVK